MMRLQDEGSLIWIVQLTVLVMVMLTSLMMGYQYQHHHHYYFACHCYLNEMSMPQAVKLLIVWIRTMLMLSHVVAHEDFLALAHPYAMVGDHHVTTYMSMKSVGE
jgi:hypothetical protein